MECNKDEARRAMDVAEKKLSENDYVGAKKFVNKAQNLYPKLDGLKQVLMMIHVYISASKNGKGEADWYGVLGVDPLADDEAVKKQYKKLALLLHPDKNKCKGAEEAFKLVSEAWCLLSDKAKRIAYDQKRKSKTGMQKPPNPHKPASNNGNRNAGVNPSGGARSNKPAGGMQRPPNTHKPASNNGNQNARDGVDPSGGATSNKPAGGMQRPPNPHKPASDNGNRNAGVDPSAKARSNKPAPAPAGSSNQEKCGTIWTMCNKCKTQFAYIRDNRLGNVRLCPNCGHTFIATDNSPWSSFVRPVPNFSSSPQQQQQRRTQNKATNKNTNGASASGRNSSPSVNATAKAPGVSFVGPFFNISSSHQQQQQWSYSSDTCSVHWNCSFSVTASSNSGNAANQTRERPKRGPEEEVGENCVASAAARGNANEVERPFKKPMTTRNSNSTLEAKRPSQRPMTTGNTNSSVEAKRILK